MNGTKPEYKVPSMEEIKKIPWNGYNVVSTFSGGGGSCLGYKMAGFRVIWANEFVEEAQKTYRANNEDTILNTQDIRTVTPEKILSDICMQKGDIDLFDGSPPCCAFSTAGKKEKGWNKKRAYSDGKVQQVEDLFFEYIRLLDGLQPKVFVAENVSGLIKGKSIGYFKIFINEMRACGYNVKAQLLNAKWLGVPQARERIIFVGVRKDLGIEPVFPKPLPYVYTLKDAFKGVKSNEREELFLINEMKKYAIGTILSRMPKNPIKPVYGANVTHGSYFNLVRQSFFCPSSTICQTQGVGVANCCHPTEERKLTINELRRITSIPDDFILTGNYKQQWERLARMVPPVMMMHIAKTIKENILDKR